MPQVRTPQTAREIASRRADVVRLLAAMRPDLRGAEFDSVDDLANEVLCLILRYEAMGMRSRFDPSRAAWTNYLIRVATSVIRTRKISLQRRAAAYSRLCVQ